MKSMSCLLLAIPLIAAAAEQPPQPNIIFILADDLGYGGLSCFGQEKVPTPQIDRLAAEGMRFTDFYAGSTVCAPSRCVLMTGMHTGRCWIRGNSSKKVDERVPLRPTDVTVSELLKKAGYTTALIGKWGLGEPDTTGIPNRKGFDYFFGYLNQRHAHDYYPDYLWRNQEKVALTGNLERKRQQYSHDLFTQEALEFVEKNKSGPFFLYLALTIPHAHNARQRDEGMGMEVPDYGPYDSRDWTVNQKGHAAMIDRMDRDIGLLMAKLDELGIGDNTLVMFTSDNGPHREGGYDPDFFDSSGPLRGIKRDLYEGGIRVPTVARWPARIKPGQVNREPLAFWDVLPTLTEIAGASPPDTDGISFLPALLGKEQKSHEYLYWEFHEGTFAQAVRMGRYKGLRKNMGPLELYDLESDIGEQRNVAHRHPGIVDRTEKIMAAARTDSEHWPVRLPAAPARQDN
jgi:arylsulfatase A-like enzyme